MLGSTPRNSDLIGLGYALGIRTFNNSPCDFIVLIYCFPELFGAQNFRWKLVIIFVSDAIQVFGTLIDTRPFFG